MGEGCGRPRAWIKKKILSRNNFPVTNILSYSWVRTILMYRCFSGRKIYLKVYNSLNTQK